AKPRVTIRFMQKPFGFFQLQSKFTED
ncbi:hypothetical protein FHS69_001342, partial [Erythrobacter flavus]|nr:hypothetical protein [Qipengyuania flava]